jgi:predicted O-methyltransferase YrrM
MPRQFLINLHKTFRLLPVLIEFSFRNGMSAFKIPTQLTITERVLLYLLGKKLPENSILVEIGSYHGGSSQFLAFAAEINDSTLICVDTWKSDGMTIDHRDTYNEFKRNMLGFSHRVKAMRGYSNEIAKDFKEQIDLLFVDGDHSYDGCRADVQAWSPHLAKGAIIIFHDYSWAEGVRRVVKEMIAPIQNSKGTLVHGTYFTTVDPTIIDQ